MWSKLIWSVAAVLAAALLAFVAGRTIAAYGDARYYAGLADGQLRQWPEILASHAAAAQNVVAERDRIIDAEVRHTTELARISALARRSDQELYAYAATATGRADCLVFIISDPSTARPSDHLLELCVFAAPVFLESKVVKFFCTFGFHRWRAPARHDASTFARCTTCRSPALFRRKPAPMV